MDQSLEGCDDLVDLLRYQSAYQGDKLAFRFIESNGIDYQDITYLELDTSARAIAASLLNQGYTKGSRVILIYPPGLELIKAFFGSLYAGLIAVPVYPPMNTKLVEKLQNVILNAQPCAILSTSEAIQQLKQLKRVKWLNQIPVVNRIAQNFYGKALSLAQWDIEHLSFICTDNIPTTLANSWIKPAIDGNTLAFFQYTSGSTGIPKGVMLQHASLLHNLAVIKKGYSLQNNEICVSWLPPYHDFGLIGMILGTIYTGTSSYQFSPLSFLKKPSLWLKTISDIKLPVISGAPNFAYEYCVKKIHPELRSQFDLSNWELALNAAEPVRADTLRSFVNAFSGSGFSKNAFVPCYGMAEVCLFISCSPRGQGASIISTPLEGLSAPKDLVGCGVPIDTITIIDTTNHRHCLVGEIGEVCHASRSLAAGYWQQEELTKATFQYQCPGDDNTYLRTGDLGFLDESGELFITGRIKDLIIIRGVNHYPQDIEYSVSYCHPQLCPDQCVAFPISVNEEEQLAVICETISFNLSQDGPILAQAIKDVILKDHGLIVYEIVLIEPRTLLKTTSGKVRRKEMKKAMELNQLAVVYDEIQDVKTQEQSELINSALSLNQSSELDFINIIQTAIAKQLRIIDAQQIDINKQFYELGLDSLMLMEINQQVHEALHDVTSLDAQDMFEQDTIAKLAACLVSRKITASVLNKPSKYITMQKAPPQSLILASEGQKRLFYLSMLYPESYNLGVIYRVNEPLDALKFAQAIEYLVAKNPIYSINLSELNHQLYQVIQKDREIKPVIFASESDVLNQLKELIYKPYDLEHDPLFRVGLLINHDHTDFVLACHHSITDLVSMQWLMTELFDVYDGLTQNTLPKASKAPYNFFDYAVSVALHLNSNNYHATSSYWLNKFSKGSNPTVLIPNQNNPNNRFLIKTLTTTLSSELTKQILDFSKMHHVSVFNVLYASFFVFLYRHTQHNEVTIGLATHGREQQELGKIHGFLTKILPASLTIVAEIPFDDFLKTVNRINHEDMQHQPLDLVDLIAQLDKINGEHGGELFKILFNYNSAHIAQRLNDTDQLFVEEGMSNYPLGFSWNHSQSSQLDLDIKFNTYAYSQDYIQAIHTQYITLVESLITHPEVALFSANLVDDPQSLLKMSQGLNIPEYCEQDFITCFDHVVRHAPLSIAVSDETKSLSYHQLDEQSNQIASLLHKYHVQSGSIVCILLERGIDLIASLLGVLKLNAAFVLIDRDHQPVNRTQLILDDCKASVVLMHEEDQTQFHGPVRVNIEASTEGTVMPTVPSRKASLDDLAYICYTSGSTGTPKGVMISQRALVNLCHGYRDIFDLKSGVHCGQYSSMTFDAAIGEIMPALISGAQLIIMPDTIKTDILALCTFINTHDLHHLFLPTAVYGLIHDYDLPGLKTLIVAGEPLHRMVVKSYRLFNAYGPTENAVCTTLKEVNKDDKITIGQPIANVQTYIVDALLRPVPIGVVGELMIGGKSLAKGYINQPEKTQERFIDSPFQPDEQLFKTGDMCRFLPNGDIEYEGRRDFQVKIRGMRVELDEIDACLQQNSDIKVAASIFDEQHQCIRCFIQPEDFINPAVYDEKSLVRTDWLSELFTHLKLSLPSYMTPSTIDILRVMPLNENGKIDRKALKKLKPQINHVVNEELPTSPIELQLAHLWQEILPIKTIGRQQSFFDLGGHSLMIAELKLKIHHTFAKNPSINDLYRHQTIASQAQWIEQNSIENTTDDILLPLAPDDNKSPVFLIHPINGDAGCYVHLTRRLRPNFSVYALQSAALKLDDERLSIENLAREYIKEIKTIGNQQTYTLIGWSMGGIIAFEMAKQLSEEGLTAKVIMLDSYLPDYLTLKRLSHEEHQAILIRLFMQQLQALYGIDFDAEFHLSDFTMQLEEVLSNSMILKIEQDKIMRELQFYQRHHLALMNYQPSKAPVELLFIYCTEMFDLFVPPQKEVIKKYWSQYLDGVPCRIEAIKANHLNLLTPQFLSIQMTIIYEFLGMKIE